MKYYHKAILLMASDAFLLISALVGACYLAGYFLQVNEVSHLLLLAAVMTLQLGVFLRFGFYRALLCYASVDFLVSVVKGASIATVVLMVGFYTAQIQVPIQVLIIDWFLTVAFIGGSRFFVRYYFELRQRYQKGRKVLIYGAGDMGSLALRQLLLNKAVLYSPVGFIDDDNKKIGSVIRSVKVLGSLDDLENILERVKVEEVVVAIAELEGAKLQNVVKRCRQKNVICRIIPCFSRLVELEPEIRNVELADLMRRTPRDLDKEAIKKFIENKVILITGAAGSIGSEIVRQCLKFSPHRILALDQSEYGLYLLQEELGASKIECILSDTTKRESLVRLFQEKCPDIIFHAAAYKHVPLLEANVSEAVINNIQSIQNLCSLCEQFKVKHFVMVSTDKAVRPSSVMGATKRICEMMVQNFKTSSNTSFVSVRFGNVLGSSGSVVPKFIEQIRKGGPVTITHPDATRYFMLIEEAALLVLQASAIGKEREIFILDMGKPMRISDMAEDLIYLMGRQPYKDIDLSFVGLRPGEKIHEELFNNEIEKSTRFKEITIAKPQMMDWEILSAKVDSILKKAHESNDATTIIRAMKELVIDGSF